MENPKTYQTSELELSECRKKLFTEPPSKGDQYRAEQGSLLYSTVKKQNHIDATYDSSHKKIKLKQHVKTESHFTPTKSTLIKMKTSPVRLSPNKKKPLLDKSFNTPSQAKHIKTYQSEWYPNREKSNQKTNLMVSQLLLMPSPNKASLNNSIFKKNSLLSAARSKPEHNTSTKSKKKMHFTIFQNRSNSSLSRSKQPNQPFKNLAATQQTKTMAMPYPYNSSITINLFQSDLKVPTPVQRSRSKSNKSRENRSISTKKRPDFCRSLNSSKERLEVNSQISQAIVKIASYKFVDDYMQRWEIEQQLKAYQFQGEPECRWPLLIVDEVFKRMRSGGKLQNIVAKA